jgi:hypothetical protein
LELRADGLEEGDKCVVGIEEGLDVELEADGGQGGAKSRERAEERAEEALQDGDLALEGVLELASSLVGVDGQDGTKLVQSVGKGLGSVADVVDLRLSKVADDGGQATDSAREGGVDTAGGRGGGSLNGLEAGNNSLDGRISGSSDVVGSRVCRLLVGPEKNTVNKNDCLLNLAMF